jgi:hypothetical protein
MAYEAQQASGQSSFYDVEFDDSKQAVAFALKWA